MDGYVTIKTTMDNKNFDAQIDHIEEQLKEIEYKLKQADMGYEVGDTLKMESQYEKLNNQLIRLKKNQDEVAKADLKNVHTSMEKASKGVEKLNNTMSKGIKRILRFSVALIGVESLFTVLSKAFNSNEEAVKKMENVWKGLGAVLQPVVDWITDKLMYGVAVVNEFVKALTGIDFVARANAKALDKQANAQKNLNKQTFSFDEMNIAQNNNSSSSSDSSDLIELPMLSEETISKIHSVANSVKEIWDSTQGIRDILKKIIDFALKHPGVVLTILGGAKLAGWISSIIGVAGGTAGLFGIAAALTIIAGISIANVIDEISELNDEMNANTKTSESAVKSSNDFRNSLKGQKVDADTLISSLKNFKEITMEGVQQQANLVSEMSFGRKTLNGLTEETRYYKTQINNLITEQLNCAMAMDTAFYSMERGEEETMAYIEYLLVMKDRLINVNNTLSENKASQEEFASIISNNNTIIETLDDKINQLSGTLETNTENMNDLGSETESSKNKVNDLFSAINNLKDKAVKILVNGDTSGLKGALNGIFDSPLLAPIKNVFENITGFKFPKLAVGGIVNNPGRGVPMGSYIAGEAGREGILPLTDSNAMAQLGQEIGKWITVQNVSNTYLNGRLIQRQIDQTSKDKNFETNGW